MVAFIPFESGEPSGQGYDFVHAAVDDRSRLAFAEICPDERKETACAFLERALVFFAERGVSVERVLTDIQPESTPYRSLDRSAGGMRIGRTGARPPSLMTDRSAPARLLAC